LKVCGGDRWRAGLPAVAYRNCDQGLRKARVQPLRARLMRHGGRRNRSQQRDQAEADLRGRRFGHRHLWCKRQRDCRLGADLIGKAGVQRHLLVLQQANHQQRHNPQTEAAHSLIKDAQSMSHLRKFLSFVRQMPVLMRSELGSAQAIVLRKRPV